jgi:hypothetical protein
MDESSRGTSDMQLSEKRALLAALLRRQTGQQRFYPLSFAQQRLWFIHQLAPLNFSYNLSVAVRLSGNLDIGVFERCFNEIIARHQVLRTTFARRDDQPVQIVATASIIALPVTDLGYIAAEEREAEAHRIINEEARLSFDLEKGPLLRVKVLRLAPDEHVLLVVMHHIISDGWSMGVLVRELNLLYEAFSQGRESPLEKMSLQYADYAVWQRAQMTDAVLAEGMRYWRAQLAGAPEALALRTDRERPPEQSYRGASFSFVVDRQVIEILKALSREIGATLFMTLLAAVEVSLYRHTSQEDICIGTPVTGRHRRDLEALIGFFVNTVVLRVRLGGNPTFREIVGRAQKVLLDAQEHDDLPFEMVIEALRPKRVVGRTPFCQLMLGFTASAGAGAGSEATGVSGIRVEPFGTRKGTAKTDIELNLFETNQGLIGAVEYNTDLFDSRTILRITEDFNSILRNVALKPDLPLNEMQAILVRDDQKRQIERDKESTEVRRWQLKNAKRKTHGALRAE